jgi:acyl-CoA thioesterase-2
MTGPTLLHDATDAKNNRLFSMKALLSLEGSGKWSFRSSLFDPNTNDRAFGGQLLAQALVAMGRTVAAREPTMLQAVFLSGAQPGRPLSFAVSPLQDGSRFSSRHVRVMQGERAVLDASATFQLPLDGYEHRFDCLEPVPEPETLPTFEVIAEQNADLLARNAAQLPISERVDLRLIEGERHLFERNALAKVRYWIRLRQSPGDDPASRAAGFAYLSDFWLGGCALSVHEPLAFAGRKAYVASLNHALWMHRPCRPDEWLLFDVESPIATGGRGLAVARVFRRDGQLIASLTQEMGMFPRVGGSAQG